ncbi:Acyl carrier protein [compost metagenome]
MKWRNSDFCESALCRLLVVGVNIMSSAQVADAQIERQVIKILSVYFPAGRRKIEIGSRLVEDLYVDSIGFVEIAMMLNEAFSMEMPEAGVARWMTVADICFLVEKHQNINVRNALS